MTLEGLIVWLVVGLSAGWLAGMVMRGRGFGVGGNILIGIAGSFLGGLLFSLSGFGTSHFLASIGVGTVGAVLLIVILGMLPGRSTL